MTGLPVRNNSAARAVVLIDSIEVLRSPNDSDERLSDAHSWLRELYDPDSPLLIILAGRDRLRWQFGSEGDSSSSSYFTEYLVGGLSETDARAFLNKCGISDLELQTAILAACACHDTADKNDIGYHAFSLGLCADTCANYQKRNETIDSASFVPSEDDVRKLASRFLRSLGGDGVYAEWLKRLALTDRFDEIAARKCFSSAESLEQNFAWASLLNYSFLQDAGDGWFFLHSRMKEVLDEILLNAYPARHREAHSWWQAHWRGRSEFELDPYAALAWFHNWNLDYANALPEWDRASSDCLKRGLVHEHAELLTWFDPIPFALVKSPDTEIRLKIAASLVCWASHLSRSPLGSRAVNLQTAIDCLENALTVYTKENYPQAWAMTQHNLGIVYRNLTTGDRAANLQKAIDCYENALTVVTKENYPQDWAKTQNNLGNVYRDLTTDDRAANLQKTIDCYKNALAVFSELDYPLEHQTVTEDLTLVEAELAKLIAKD